MRQIPPQMLDRPRIQKTTYAAVTYLLSVMVASKSCNYYTFTKISSKITISYVASSGFLIHNRGVYRDTFLEIFFGCLAYDSF